MEDWKARFEFAESERLRLRSFLSDGNLEILDSEKSWRDRARKAEAALDSEREKVIRECIAAVVNIPATMPARVGDRGWPGDDAPYYSHEKHAGLKEAIAALRALLPPSEGG